MIYTWIRDMWNSALVVTFAMLRCLINCRIIIIIIIFFYPRYQ